MSFLSLKRLQNHIFNYSEAMSWSSLSLLLSISTPGSTSLAQSSNQFMQLGWWKSIHVLKGWEKAGTKGVITGKE